MIRQQTRLGGVRFKGLLGAVAAGALALAAPSALAHCDGLDGPVVTAAREALRTGDVNRVLIWVRPQDAAEIRTAFQQALAVRRLGAEAQSLADTYFFETLVRVHRTAEGAPYTGLAPAGRDLGPAIPAADAALVSGSEEALVALITGEVRAGLHAHFQEALARRRYRADDVAAGRDYVQAYVSYIHYVERLHEAARNPSAGHYEEAH